jgi:hypothetical protein
MSYQNRKDTTSDINKSIIVKGFNKHFEEFIEDVQSIFPEDDEVVTMKNLMFLLKKSNPRIIMESWNMYISTPYKEPIENGDISFFINKDYSADLTMFQTTSNVAALISLPDSISSFIERLRGYVRNMTEENQQKSMKYIQNLCNLTKLYYG